jgi:rod shape-determining protein MreC
VRKYKLFSAQNVIVLIIILIFLLYAGLRFFFSDISFLQILYTPFGNSLSYIQKQLNQPFLYLTSSDQLIKENKQLKERIDQYQLLLQNYEELAEENKRLKVILNTKEQKPFIKKIAVVIGKSPDIWHKEITINLGKNQGVKVNTVVTSTWGLLGKVRAATGDSAIVQLIIDSSNWVSTQNNRSRAVGMLKVEGSNRGKLSYLMNKSDFKQNDLIVTSGLGGIYPKGIPVGIVTRVAKKSGDDIPDIDVSLLSDFDNIEEVIVLIKNEK